MRSTSWLVSLAVAAVPAGCAAQSAPAARTAADAEAGVVAAHERRRIATLAADVPALDSTMTADLTFTHANGVVDSKADFLGALRSRRLQYRSITDEERRVRVHGDAGVVSGTCHLVVTASGAPIDIRVRFTELWTREGGRWRMVLWHAAPVP